MKQFIRLFSNHAEYFTVEACANNGKAEFPWFCNKAGSRKLLLVLFYLDWLGIDGFRIIVFTYV